MTAIALLLASVGLRIIFSALEQQTQFTEYRRKCHNCRTR